MNFFKKALNSVQGELKEIKEKGKVAIQKIEEKIHQKIGDKPSIASVHSPSFEPEVIHVMDRIYWMNFPSNEKINALSKYLNTTFAKQYYIWNVSEHKYDVVPFNEQVQDYNVPGYPSPTLQEIFVICKGILSWLDSDPANVAIIHCQNTRGRSALIISCLLCLRNKFLHPGEALTFFCQQTHAKDMSILFPSQLLYLNYFSNVINGVKLDNKKLKLKKIIFGEVPNIVSQNNSEGELFRPYIQVFKDSKIIYNSLNSGKVTQYKQSDLSIWFDLEGAEVTEDILIRCKHYQSNSVRVPVFRMMLHSGFTQNNVQRLLKTEIDFAENIVISDQFFIDVIFEEGTEEPVSNGEKKQTNLEYIVDECRRQFTHNSHSNPNPEDDAQKQIQMILDSTCISSAASFETSVFSIGDSDSAEKRKQSYDGDEEFDETSTPQEDPYQVQSFQTEKTPHMNQSIIQQQQQSQLHQEESQIQQLKQEQHQQMQQPQQELIQQQQGQSNSLTEIEPQLEEPQLKEKDSKVSGLSDSKNTIENSDLVEVEHVTTDLEEKKKVSKMLFGDKIVEPEMDDQEIDDYLDNLGKSDDES